MQREVDVGPLADLLQALPVQLRGLGVGAVDVADRDREAGDAGLLDEPAGLIGIGEPSGGDRVGNVLAAGEVAELALDLGAVGGDELPRARATRAMFCSSSSFEPSAITAPQPRPVALCIS